MNPRCALIVLAVLAVAGSAQAQQPAPTPQSVNVGGNVTLGYKDFCKGWYLYWPAEALTRPRLPMPFPYWPQQAAAQPTPPPSPPPAPLQLPPLSGTSWAPNPYTPPFQPVSYPVSVPGYWYPR
jgi:hypothetical protein